MYEKFCADECIAWVYVGVPHMTDILYLSRSSSRSFLDESRAILYWKRMENAISTI
jgi:hypothetical protein